MYRGQTLGRVIVPFLSGKLSQVEQPVSQDLFRTAPAAPPAPDVRPMSGAELRGAQRFTLLVRSAKLIIDGREYLCVLRDASATGCKVRTFHPLPSYSSLALETSNGDRFPMEKMWERDDHAGFRFFEAIDVQRLLDDKSGLYAKRQIRLKTDAEVIVFANGQQIRAMMRDISQQGACIECPERLMLRQPVRIETAGFPQIFAKVVWRQQPRHGLVFDRSFQMDELAQNMARMHELQASPPTGRHRTAC